METKKHRANNHFTLELKHSAHTQMLGCFFFSKAVPVNGITIS